jgi:superfamily II DNA helicase RecQ
MGSVPIMAVTATATDKIIEDVQTILGIPDFIKIMKIPNRYTH